MNLVNIIGLTATATFVALATISTTPALAESAKFTVQVLADKTVSQLPDGDLHWHVENFATLEDAKAAAGEHSLAAEYDDKVWLFTLSGNETADMGGTPVASIGPVPRIEAVEYLLRVNTGHAPVGARTSVHSHPGPESFLILSGQITQRTPHGQNVLSAGETMAGTPDQAMELHSTGDEDLRELIMFVVDPLRPFSTQEELN